MVKVAVLGTGSLGKEHVRIYSELAAAGQVELAGIYDSFPETARKIAAKSPAMIQIAKESLNGVEDGNLEDKYRWEQGFTLQAYTSPDSAETRRAFVEKREVKF